MSPDPFGDVIDADTIEEAAIVSLKAWLPAMLAHQERRRGLPAGTLPQPRSWPTVSDFDVELHTLLPAVVLISPGTSGTPVRDQKGAYRAMWQIQVAVVVADATEKGARKLAAMYIAAVRGALVRARTLGDTVEHCRWVGLEDHAFGTTAKGAARAIYGTAFDVTVRDAVNDRTGPSEPPPDPYNPEPPPPSPTEAQIDIEASFEED